MWLVVVFQWCVEYECSDDIIVSKSLDMEPAACPLLQDQTLTFNAPCVFFHELVHIMRQGVVWS